MNKPKNLKKMLKYMKDSNSDDWIFVVNPVYLGTYDSHGDTIHYFFYVAEYTEDKTKTLFLESFYDSGKSDDTESYDFENPETGFLVKAILSKEFRNFNILFGK